MTNNQVGYILTMHAKPGRGQELHDLVARVTAESGDVESWIFSAPDGDPDTLIGIEFYRDDATLAAHEESPAVDAVRDQIIELLADGGERTLIRPTASSVPLLRS